MIIGSANTWVTIPHFATTSISGTEHGGEGWISLIAGIVLCIVGVALALSGDTGGQVLGQLAAAAAGAGFAVALYFTDHLGSLGGSHAGIGWGLIVVLLASIAALIAAVGIGLTSDH
jgi:drug/metabolite transporter (DMT)-like permease